MREHDVRNGECLAHQKGTVAQDVLHGTHGFRELPDQRSLDFWYALVFGQIERTGSEPERGINCPALVQSSSCRAFNRTGRKGDAPVFVGKICQYGAGIAVPPSATTPGSSRRGSHS